MAHEIRIKMNTAVVKYKDFEVFVRNGESKLGTLLISRGNIEWIPKGNYVNKSRLSWENFAELMKEYGTRKKLKKK